MAYWTIKSWFSFTGVVIELMISARLLLILHKYAGIYMGASAQGGRTLASEKFGTGPPGWSGLGWLGQSWPRAAGQSQGPLSGHSAQTIFAPSSVRSADWKFRAWKISSKLSASNCKCINIFFPTFLLLHRNSGFDFDESERFFYLVICKIPWNQRKCQHFFFVLQMIEEKIVF